MSIGSRSISHMIQEKTFRVTGNLEELWTKERKKKKQVKNINAINSALFQFHEYSVAVKSYS